MKMELENNRDRWNTDRNTQDNYNKLRNNPADF